MLKKIYRKALYPNIYAHPNFSTSKSNSLGYFNETSIGSVQLSNRIAAATLNNARSDPTTSSPNDLHLQYYSQRASFGLLISEFIAISRSGKHHERDSGIWQKAQQDEWKKIVRKVHERGGKIFGQIGHAGRLSNSYVCGNQPIAPSAIEAPKEEDRVFDLPRDMNIRDIKTLLNEYYQAAKKIDSAEFDGVEITAANGYLLDQFLKEGTNQRTDEYGGTLKSRCRMCIEIVDIMHDIFGAERVGLKISPFSNARGMAESKPLELYSHLLKELSNIGLGYLHIVLSDEGSKNFDKTQSLEFIKAIKKHYNGVIIANGIPSIKEGLDFIQNKNADLISFGSLSLGNPDLPARVKNEWPINEKIDMNQFKQGGSEGFVDFDFFK